MNKRLLPLLIVLAFLLAGLASARTGEAAHAQGCTDPTGNPIPCPGQDKKTPTPVPPRATFTSTPTATALPTETPLPISNPADDGATEVKWSGTCSGVNKNTPCTDKLINACNAAGGTPDASFDDEADTTTITCTLPAILEPTPLPLGIPTDEGTVGGEKDWEGFCKSKKNFTGKCFMALINACKEDGGTDTLEQVNGGYKVKCTYPSTLPEGTATAMPLSIPAGDHVGTCNASSENFQECMDQMERQCDDGTLVIKVDLYSGDGTVYDFYCIPHKPTFPPGGWLPWITGLGGLIVGVMLLPAIQKFKNKPEDPQRADTMLTLNDIPGESNARMPNNKNPELVKADGGDEHQAVVAIPNFSKMEISYRGSPRDTPPPPPPPPPPPSNSAPAEDDGMQLKAKRAEVQPQTREHVLLANDPTDPSEAKSKPKPPPPSSSGSITYPYIDVNVPLNSSSPQNSDSLTTGRDDVITREDKDKG